MINNVLENDDNIKLSHLYEYINHYSNKYKVTSYSYINDCDFLLTKKGDYLINLRVNKKQITDFKEEMDKILNAFN